MFLTKEDPFPKQINLLKASNNKKTTKVATFSREEC